LANDGRGGWHLCFDVLRFAEFTLQMSSRVILRDVVDADLASFFEHQSDPEAARMAAFPSRDHDAFLAHWTKLRRDHSNIICTIVCDGRVAGNIGSWVSDERRLVGYWIGREFWGRGVATAALAAFVAKVRERPLHAFVAEHNVGSIRVLEKCDFVPSPEHDPGVPGEDGVREILYALRR
jgi:RimJ/RimL family protein N-acetyltransferase